MISIKPVIKRLGRGILISILGLSVLSCGSELAIVSAGISGTGIVVGTITTFGSIVVNGVHYNIDNASLDVNGTPYSNLSRDEQRRVLSVGMVVRLMKVTDNGDGTGEASSVVYDASFKGPVLDIQSPQAGNPDLKQLTVVGQDVLVIRNDTRFEDVDIDTIAINDIVEISGFVDQQGVIHATLLKKEGDLQPGDDVEIELHGVISALDFSLNSFQLNNQVISFDDQTELKDIDSLDNDLMVEVKALYQADGSVLAERIELDEAEQKEIESATGEVKMQGFVSNLDTANFTFIIDGVTADYSGIEIASTVGLVEGVEVEVRGKVSNAVLVLNKLEIETEDSSSDD